MITKEVNDWVIRVECGMYSDEDVMYEFSRIAKYLTREELIMIKRKLSSYIKQTIKKSLFQALLKL